jgi:pyruvate dehydrogenase E2 component (dihydrolipoamide acetyltransferase)
VAQVTEVKVPDIGDFTDVPVIEILVEVGQEIAPEDPLIALESDKATMEVPAPSAGVVEEILVKVGDRVSEGTPILKLGGGDEKDADDGPPQDAAPEPVEAATEAEESDPAAVESAPEVRPQEAEDEAPAQTAAQRGGAEPREAGGDEPAYASPSARRLARERGIDLSRIQGSGRKGRITAEDVEKAGSEGAPAEGAPQGAPAAQAAEGDERVALSRIKRISGPRLQQAWQTIPHVTQFDEADITDLEAFRKQVNAEQSDVKVTMVALMMKACVASLKAFPEVNSSLDDQELILRRSYHIGFAADTPQGLLVPVIHDVDRKGLLAVAGELTELSGVARSGKISPAQMQGATFTISSLGGIGGTAFTPIINPPQVAILGVSRSAMKPVWDGGQFVPRLMVPLSFSYDHRVIDGALAARFTAHLSKVLTDLRRVLL